MPQYMAYPQANTDDATAWGTYYDYNFTSCTIGNITGSGAATMMLRCPSIPIPQGSTIISCEASFRASSTQSSTTVNLRIYCNDIDNAVAPANKTAFDALDKTTAYADWDNVAAWTLSTRYSSPDLSSVLQEVIDRPGWVSNNAVIFLIQDNGSSSGAVRDVSDYKSSSSYVVYVYIQWIPPGDTSYHITASADDGKVETDGDNFSATDLSAGIYLGYASSAYWNTWFRFNIVTIPAGAQITSAFLRVYIQSASEIGTQTLRYYFNDADNAVAPTNSGEYTALDLTTAYVDQSLSPTTWPLSGSQYDSPDLASVLQEVIDRPGWASGQSVMLLVKTTGAVTTSFRVITSYELCRNNNTYYYEPELHVEYEIPGQIEADTLSLSLQLSSDGIIYPRISETFGMSLSFSASFTANVTITASPFVLSVSGSATDRVVKSISTETYHLIFGLSSSYARVLYGTLILRNALELGGSLDLLNEILQLHEGTITLKNVLTELNKLSGTIALKNLIVGGTYGMTRGEYYYDRTHRG